MARNIILRYSKQGDLILDQMCGSGTTLIEAKLLGRNAIGIDINEEAIMITRDRLNFDVNSLFTTYQKTYIGDARNLNFVREKGIINYTETDLNREMKNNFTLVDVDNEQTYPVDELENANLSMDGKHTRTFRWVKGSVKKRDFDPVVLPE